MCKSLFGAFFAGLFATAALASGVMVPGVPSTVQNTPAPSTPASGSTAIYVDSTNKVLSSENDAGVISHTVQTISSIAHKFITTINGDGSATQTQPACGDLSNGAASCSTDTTNASNISSGTLATARGGTNAASGAPAANNLSLPYVVCVGVPNNALTGSTSLTQLNTTACKIPAGTLAAGDIVEVYSLWTYTNNSDTKTIEWLAGTSNGTGGTACTSATATTTAAAQNVAMLAVIGSSSEACWPIVGQGTTTTALATPSLSVSAAIYINFVAQLASSSDTITLIAYSVKILQSAGN